MFTGIIEEIGRVERVHSFGAAMRMRIGAPFLASEIAVNDSVSINGVCQTVIGKERSSFDVEAVEETLKKTTLGSFAAEQKVNLELPMKLNGRFDGHIVLGHVDTVGRITNIEPRENSWMFSISYPEPFSRYVVHVGSIAVDGVSLTIAETQAHILSVSIIPHTMKHTIFQFYSRDSMVNLEFDIIGKYVEQMNAKRADTPETSPLFQ